MLRPESMRARYLNLHLPLPPSMCPDAVRRSERQATQFKFMPVSWRAGRAGHGNRRHPCQRHCEQHCEDEGMLALSGSHSSKVGAYNIVNIELVACTGVGHIADILQG